MWAQLEMLLLHLSLRDSFFSPKQKHTVPDPGEKWRQCLGKEIRKKTKGHISNLKSKTLERCFQIIRFNR